MSILRFFVRRRWALIAILAAAFCGMAKADSFADRLQQLRNQFARQFSVPIEDWRFEEGDITNAEQPDFDDSSWRPVPPGFSWPRRDGTVWLRAKIIVPERVGGQPTTGFPARIEVGVRGRCELYVNGQLRDDFRGNDGRYTVGGSAHPGESFCVALRVPGPGGRLDFARLLCNVAPDFDRYIDEITFISELMPEVGTNQQETLKQALDASEQCIQFTSVSPENLDSVRAQLAAARAALLPVAEITRKYDVYYIGHSHIDMCWQWSWPETIDVCHRTWNSAMNLMNEFPDFHFVQSQPAAYVPIEADYPDEFARMQRMSADGQWDIVGGMWNESDTDIPSGEGLARSFLLGQEFFKSKFGKYAVTGWLPDSFGHTWQLPQIMELSGIKYYYHMRCGNGMELTWWQSPDGSRVLKANTRSYDAKPDLEQLTVPIHNASQLDMPQSVVIFGVGDHGGGPTREQILRIQSFQQDPIFPHVHFISADAYFEQLAKQPTADSLPVVDNDLQYTFTGCYTTHADMKKALRRSEDNLYSAEVLSSLAAMMGAPYPATEFQAAWKPTAFAQFHDIAAGSAIHSTYEWMHQQLAPAFRFEKRQTDKCLEALTADSDTRGPGTNAIIVWNTLSFERNDVVRVAIANAGQYHSVLDNDGHEFPAQALGNDTLVFIARQVPAFGHKAYFPSSDACPSDGISLQDDGHAYHVQTPDFDLRINKKTGCISRLYSQRAQWNVFGDGPNANAFELLGDTGSAWTIRYTGTDQILADNGTVSVLDQGPVFDRIRITHVYGESTYTQDVIVYGALDRIDIPTTIHWQEHGELLKIRFPLNAAHVEASAQIPFGSKERPANGQECPGQKWMDATETIPVSVHNSTPLNLSRWFNNSCGEDFDGNGAHFPAKLLPGPGIRRLGSHQVPFLFPSHRAGQPDNVIADGQRISIPATAKGTVLFVLGARSRGRIGTAIGFEKADGTIEFRAFDLNDWKSDISPDDEAGLSFPYEHPRTGHASESPTLWIAHIRMPKGTIGLVLPHDPNSHIFAATTASKPEESMLYGLSVLNDSKYGFDVSNNVFRLTALRSSDHPDPEPDQGMQQFTYSLYPHACGWRRAHTDEQALGLNIPLLATVALPHPPTQPIPSLSLENIGGNGDLIATALKRSEDGRGFILRFYEADGQDTRARVVFDRPMHVEETDILERPIPNAALTVEGNSVTLPVGHNRIVTLRFVDEATR